MKKYFFFLILLTFSLSLQAQVSGNQVYSGSNNNYRYNANRITSAPFRNVLTSTDSSLYISTSVLLNKVADSYQISLGLNEEDSSAQICNKKIDHRIKKFISSLKKLGVLKEDIYVDFISQTKVYDYTTINQNQSQQIDKGFEVKKNLLIQFKDLNLVDQIVKLAADQGIYDIIKVEYIDLNTEAIYDQLYNEAIKLIEKRKDRFLKNSNLKANGVKRIQNEQFSTVHPKTQYLQYQAFESSQLEIQNSRHNNRYITKEARKNRTFYYEGLSTTQFDQIIAAEQVVVGTQYVLRINYYYELQK